MNDPALVSRGQTAFKDKAGLGIVDAKKTNLSPANTKYELLPLFVAAVN